MAKKLSADELMNGIAALEENTRNATLVEVMEEFIDFANGAYNTPADEAAGYGLAADFIANNYALTDEAAKYRAKKGHRV